VTVCAAAFAEKAYGSFPLWMVEQVWFAIAKPSEARVGDVVKENARLLAASIRERVMVAGLDDAADEVRFSRIGTEATLETRASRGRRSGSHRRS
jgi:hypothetical protein